MIGPLLRELIFRFTTIKTADRWVSKWLPAASKWLPAVFRKAFSLYRHWKMATLWRIFAGCWGILPIGTHWTGFQCISMGFFTFAWRRFCSTAILLERSIVIKRGTTLCHFIHNFLNLNPNIQAGFFGLSMCISHVENSEVQWSNNNWCYLHGTSEWAKHFTHI